MYRLHGQYLNGWLPQEEADMDRAEAEAQLAADEADARKDLAELDDILDYLVILGHLTAQLAKHAEQERPHGPPV